MTGIGVTEHDEGEEGDVHDDEPFIYYYVERLTGLMYEAQFFTGFVLVRSATPMFRAGSLQKMSSIAFDKTFEEYLGDPHFAKAIANGYEGCLTVVVKG